MNKKIGLGILALSGVLALGGMATFGRTATATTGKSARQLIIKNSTYDMDIYGVLTKDGNAIEVGTDSYYSEQSDSLFKIHHVGSVFVMSPIQRILSVKVEYECTGELQEKNFTIYDEDCIVENQFEIGESGDKISISSDKYVDNGYLSLNFRTKMDFDDIYIKSIIIDYSCSYAE